MGRILEWASSYDQGGKGWSRVVTYIKGGSPAALAQLAAMKDPDTLAIDELAKVLEASGTLDEEHRRALHAMVAAKAFSSLASWLDRALAEEGPDEDRFGTAAAEVAGQGVAPRTLLHLLANVARDDRPTSAGRALLALSDEDLAWVLARDEYSNLKTWLEFLLDAAPDRMPPILDRALDPDNPWDWDVPMEKDPARYAEILAPKVGSIQSLRCRYYAARHLFRADPARFRAVALEAARAMIVDGLEWQSDADDAMGLFGVDVRDAVIAYMKTPTRVLSDRGLSFQHSSVLHSAVDRLGRDAIPVVLAYLDTMRPEPEESHAAEVGYLMDLDDGRVTERIRQELDLGLKAKLIDHRGRFDMLELAARWGPEKMADPLWALVRDPGKRARELAVPVVAKLGDAAVRPRAIEMLDGPKADLRETAVALLAALGTPEALDAVAARRDVEPDEGVRDAILLALEAAGRPAANPDIAANVARMSASLKKPVAPWADEAKLPPLHNRDGSPLGPEATRYLLVRQSRTGEIAPDIEARALYDRIDPATGADFAEALLDRFLDSGGEPSGRWALAVAGRLGDARVVPALVRSLDGWVKKNRLKMAEYAVQALALVRDEATLSALDDVSRRYRVKPKNVAQAAGEAIRGAAERLGITLDELGDRVVPALGFEPGRPRVVEAGGKRIEVAVGLDFKLHYRDLATGKPVKSLPASTPKEAKAELKDVAAGLRDAAKAQAARLEEQLVRQRRWPVARWRGLFLDHPVLFPFAVRLIWGHYDDSGTLGDTFRAMEDRTLTRPSDEGYELPDSGSVGLVHPLELDAPARDAWRTHLADHEITPPFPQLERPVIRVPESRRGARFLVDFRGKTVHALSFKGRAERLGWTRGPVLDNGSVHAYVRKSPAGVEAVLALEDMSVQPFEDQETTLKDAAFFRSGAWNGFDYNPLPEDESDPRLLPLGDVPPVVYSEVMGDLARIAGQAGTGEGEGEED
ncbi:DUF4132 domain-containing protein [Aquisphaera giovannonii]|nr:DUF4132 domain-containing protein [Aquisphaera giovannonii]